MSMLMELGQAVRQRRVDLGISQAALARLAGLSRATINQVENGRLKDLSLTRTRRILDVLGLGLTIEPAHPRAPSASPAQPTPALVRAARSASVSYREALSPDELQKALVGDDLPAGRAPHLRALLDEVPMPVLGQLVEQVHHASGLTRSALWSRMRELARQLHASREVWAA